MKWTLPLGDSTKPKLRSPLKTAVTSKAEALIGGLVRPAPRHARGKQPARNREIGQDEARSLVLVLVDGHRPRKGVEHDLDGVLV